MALEVFPAWNLARWRAGNEQMPQICNTRVRTDQHDSVLCIIWFWSN